ncbi:MAG: hypothetical protein IJ290_04160 [Bacteroidaceae bacterium]|nr:hypothetical protein [Bacteroidaceae bacterium]
MKRFLVLTSLMMACVCFVFGQEQKQPFIQYHLTSAAGLGFSCMHTPFETQYHGKSPSIGMISCEIDLLGVYLGFGGNSKKTGYNVYGFDEYMNTAMFKVGANLKLGLKTRNEFIVLPYLGFIQYSVYDTSKNDIGARDEYGSKEGHALVGVALKMKAKDFFISMHCSTIEFGLTVGYDFSDVMDMTLNKFSPKDKDPDYSVRKARR